MRSAKIADMLFDRRALIKGALGAGLAISGLPLIGSTPVRAQFKAYPFPRSCLGRAGRCGRLRHRTRLVPEPLHARGGMPIAPVEVNWEIAADAEMKRTVRTGSAIARVETAHSLHVQVDGLEPAANSTASAPVTSTARSAASGRSAVRRRGRRTEIRRRRCQSCRTGLYTAWRRIAEKQLDFVFHYGDDIYEYARRLPDQDDRSIARSMPDNFPYCINVIDYRRRYALYKSDPDLQAAHASCAFLSSFDDHEFANNWAGESDPRNTPPEAFLFRRAAAFQAWYEHMPVRRTTLPRGPDMLAYRNFRFGNLANLAVLLTPANSGRNNPAATASRQTARRPKTSPAP